MTKIEFLKAADRLVGGPLVRISSLVPRRRAKQPTERGRVLLIRPGGIGDAVLLLPAVKVLKEHIRATSIDVLCEKRNAGVFDLSEDVGQVYLYDSAGGLTQCLRNEYDLVFDTEQWHRLSAVVARLANAPETVGFDTNERSRLFTKKVGYRHDDYEVESFLRLVESYIGRACDFNTEEAFLRVPEVRPFSEVPWGGDVVGIFPGASVPERRWGGEKFGRVAGGLEREGYRIVVLGSRQDAIEAGVIRRHATSAIDLTGRTSLKEAASVLKTCRLLVTADSGLMHIAAAVGTPTVSLFGSGIQKKWAPRGNSHVIVNRCLPCSPCTRFGYTPRCPRGVECLALISVEEVLQGAEKALCVTGP